MQRTILLLTAILVLHVNSMAQSFDQLNRLPNDSIKIYYSDHQKERAESISLRMANAMAYHHKLLEFKPDVTLLVLTEADWFNYTSFPVYGMPHYNGDKLLIVAAEDNAFWKSFLPPLEQLPEDLREQVKKVYRLKDGSISMEAFFDMLAIHELGHAFHFQAKLNMQRKWMGELFCNVFLHTYIAEKEPGLIPALTLFPKMVISNGTKEYKFTSLKDIEERYEEIGQQHAKNYGWYQCRWHAAAAKIYETSGKEVTRKIWDALKEQKLNLDDQKLMELFTTAGAGAVADMMRNW